MTAVVLLAALVMPAQAQGPIMLRYGQNAAAAKGLSSLPLNIALHKGFFAREGIALQVMNIKGGTDRIVAALDKDEIDAGKNATPYLVQAVLKGSDAVAVVSQTLNPVYSLIVRPEIKAFSDLKGKTIALSTAGDTITLATTRLLAAKGLRGGDYTARTVVGTAARFDCVVSGQCAAAPMGQPEDIVAMRSGFLRLAYTYEAGADFIFNVDMVRRAWGARNRDAVVRFVRAFAATYAFINDPANRDEMTTFVAATGGLSNPRRGDLWPVSRSAAQRVATPRRDRSQGICKCACRHDGGGGYPKVGDIAGTLCRPAVSYGGGNPIAPVVHNDQLLDRIEGKADHRLVSFSPPPSSHLRVAGKWLPYVVDLQAEYIDADAISEIVRRHPGPNRKQRRRAGSAS